MRRDSESADVPRLVGVVFLALAVCVFVPFLPARFVAAATCLAAIAGLAIACPARLGWGVLLCILYGGGFLLNPLCGASYLRFSSLNPLANAVAWQMALVLLGVVWVWSVRPGQALSVRSKKTGPTLIVAICWALLLLCFHWRQWNADVPYAGDEHYHMGSALVFGALGQLILEQVLWPGLLLGLLAGWIWSEIRHIGGRTERWVTCVFVLLGIAALACYPAPQDQPEDLSVRAIRYPALQPWISAILAVSGIETWQAGRVPSLASLRMLPLLGLFWLGWCMLRAFPVRGSAWLAKLAVVVGLLSCPLLLYFGSVLYLELPMLSLMGFVLIRSRQWILARPERVSSRFVTLALIALCFLKDTGIVAALLFCAARWVARGWFWIRSRRKKARAGQWVWPEIRLAFAILGPGLLYLMLRAAQNPRPYQLHGQNLLQGELLCRSAAEISLQIGLLCVPALFGWWRCLRSRRWPLAWTAITVGGGIWLFHFLDDPQWIGYSRFHLLLIPSAVVLAYVAIVEDLAARWRWAAPACAGVLLLANLSMSPISGYGQRAVWQYSPERWYPFSACLEEIGKLDRRTGVVLANMSSTYATAILRDRLSWRPDPFLQWPPMADVPLESLRQSLKRAGEEQMTFLVWRWDGPVREAPPEVLEGFRVVFRAASPAGELWVWQRL